MCIPKKVQELANMYQQEYNGACLRVAEQRGTELEAGQRTHRLGGTFPK